MTKLKHDVLATLASCATEDDYVIFARPQPNGAYFEWETAQVPEHTAGKNSTAFEDLPYKGTLGKVGVFSRLCPFPQVKDRFTAKQEIVLTSTTFSYKSKGGVMVEKSLKDLSWVTELKPGQYGGQYGFKVEFEMDGTKDNAEFLCETRERSREWIAAILTSASALGSSKKSNSGRPGKKLQGLEHVLSTAIATPCPEPSIGRQASTSTWGAEIEEYVLLATHRQGTGGSAEVNVCRDKAHEQIGTRSLSSCDLNSFATVRNSSHHGSMVRGNHNTG